MYKWLLSVRTHTARKDFMFDAKEGETSIDVYRRAKQEGEKIKLKYGQAVTIDIISHCQAFKKPNVPTPKNHLWCPYCRKFRLFYWDEYLEVDRCPICRITKNDYWVKFYNGLFLAEHLEAIEYAKRRVK